MMGLTTPTARRTNGYIDARRRLLDAEARTKVAREAYEAALIVEGEARAAPDALMPPAPP